MIHELVQQQWALNEDYYIRMYNVISERLQLNHDLEGLIKKTTLEDYIPRIESLLEIGEQAGHPPVEADVEVKFERDVNTGLPTARLNDKNIALIPVIGALTKYGGLCSMGMQGYQALLNRANSSPSIDGIVLIMDTPGGTVDGTPEFGLAIATSKKPVGIFGDNQVASAGVWLASQASVIVGNSNNPTKFGSIGVLMVLPNYQNVIDAGNHPKATIYRATQSTDKALVNAIEPISADAEKDLQADLDATAKAFISTVKKGRGEKLDAKSEGLFSGRMFDAYQAKQIGLIDEVGTLQTAIKKVAAIAKQQQSQIKSTNSKSNNAEMKLPKLSALLGAASSLFSTNNADKQSSLTAEQQAALEASETKLAENETQISALQADIKTKDESIVSLNAKVTELTSQVATLITEKQTLQDENTKQKAELEKKPTGNATTIIPNEQESHVASDAGGSVTQRAMLPIERQAQEYAKQNAKK